MLRRTYRLGSLIAIATISIVTAYGQDSHYAPGIFNIRDFSLPAAGLYGAIYNYGYQTDTLTDANGSRISSVTIAGPGGRLSATANVSVDVNLYALAPTMIWVPKWKVFGAKYGILLSPTLSNTSLSGLLSRAEGSGQSVSAGQFNIGDIYVVPVWLDWAGKHYDAVVNYGFYIPSGSYGVQTVNVPVVGPVRASSPSNTGLGFWENQSQGAVYLYPWADKRLAIQNAITWEVDRPKRGFDLTYGQHITWNWGLSQYLPLKKDQSVLAEVGATGYGAFQVSDNTGEDARNLGGHDRVYAAGVQVGVTIPKRMMVFNLRWLQEFDAANRFQGRVLGLSFVARLGSAR